MKTLVPQYYTSFACIADKCRHTCCVGWEIDVDKQSLKRFMKDKLVATHIETEGTPRIKLLSGERCPFLRDDGLCEMIIKHGEGYLCQICTDHPRFRNFWSNHTEIGLGLVCEHAAEIILSSSEKMRLVALNDDSPVSLSPYEKLIWDTREKLWDAITETGPKARLKEYLIYRYITGALDDGLISERTRFINNAFDEITALWDKTDGSITALTECARQWSFDVEYDDEIIEKRIKG